MFEPRLTPLQQLRREFTWAGSLKRCSILTLRQRLLRALAWIALGIAVAWLVLSRFPVEIVAAEARLEAQSDRHLVYSIGTVRGGVEARCLLVVYRLSEAFTVSC